MQNNLGLLETNVSVLRARASKRAYQGMFVALVAVLVATAITDYMATGSVSLAGLLQAQRENVALWLLDVMPFVFAFWGQYFSVVIAHEAGALVMDQTATLRADNQALEASARRGSHIDNLTGLPNRALFLDRTEQAIQQAQSDNSRVGVLVLDIDAFTEINQTLGQHSGDRVLQSVAKRLRSAQDETTTVARLSADSFAVLLPRIIDTQTLLQSARSISRALDPTFALENVAITVRASVGAAMCPEHAIDAETLLNAADLAMREAKSGAGAYVLFKPEKQKHADPDMLGLVGELRRAIDLDEIQLYVQPIVDFRNRVGRCTRVPAPAQFKELISR